MRSWKKNALVPVISALMLAPVATACSSRQGDGATSAEEAAVAAVHLGVLYADGTRKAVDTDCGSFAGLGALAAYMVDGVSTTRTADMFTATKVTMTRAGVPVTLTRSGTGLVADAPPGDMTVVGIQWSDDFSFITFLGRAAPVILEIPRDVPLAERRNFAGTVLSRFVTQPSFGQSSAPNAITPQAAGVDDVVIIIVGGMIVLGLMTFGALGLCLTFCQEAQKECSAACPHGLTEFQCNFGGAYSSKTGGNLGCGVDCRGCDPGGGGSSSGGTVSVCAP